MWDFPQEDFFYLVTSNGVCAGRPLSIMLSSESILTIFQGSVLGFLNFLLH